MLSISMYGEDLETKQEAHKSYSTHFTKPIFICYTH